jgi:hypothetical protein
MKNHFHHGGTEVTEKIILVFPNLRVLRASVVNQLSGGARLQACMKASTEHPALAAEVTLVNAKPSA